MFTVNLKIHGLHAAAAVNHHFDRNTFAVGDGLFSTFARSRESEDQKTIAATVNAAGSHVIRCRSVGGNLLRARRS